MKIGVLGIYWSQRMVRHFVCWWNFVSQAQFMTMGNVISFMTMGNSISLMTMGNIIILGSKRQRRKR